MRIWDIELKKLCRNHLLAEHRELHAIWSVITKNKKGYAHHPETMRWRGKLAALYRRHRQQVKELENRGYCHKSPLPIKYAKGLAQQKFSVNSLREQLEILRSKKCQCRI